MKRIKLTQGKFALISDADFSKVSRHKWHAEKGSSGVYYAATDIRLADGKRKTLRMHKLVLEVPTGFEVDHKDGDGLNNQRSNLRQATRAQNMHNTKAKGPIHKGITFQKRLNGRPWQARIAHEGKQVHLGYFPTAEEAASVYDKAARELFGQFARLNKVVAVQSDNKRRQVLKVVQEVEDFAGRNGRRTGCLKIELSCGHLVQLPLSQSAKIGNHKHCKEC